jgi:NADH dehydrogenase
MSSTYGSTNCPQTAQFAMRQGKQLAGNIVRHLKGLDPQPFTFTGLGELAAIGHHTAVASIMGMQFSGIIAWFMWRTIYLSKLPGLDRKLRVMIDWTLDLFFPRDINLLSPRYSKVFRQVHLEAGDHLFNRGEPAFSLYVVKTGKIELRDSEGKTVRTIQPGDFFGERALVYGGGYLYDAFATETTEIMSMGDEAILPFFEARERLRRVLSKTTTQHSAEAELAAIERKMDPAVLKKPITEVMETDIATLNVNDTVHDALQLFQKRRFSTYPLVAEGNKLIGVLSREDFFDYMKREHVSVKKTLERIVQYPLPIVKTTASVGDALNEIIRSGRYKCIVTDHDNHLKGIVTLLDLICDAESFQ